MLHIGLTGGIGSGKSSAAARLQARGALCIDSDAIARALTAPGGGAIAALRQRFGSACLTGDGALNRAWMRERAFADPAVREALEAILHPMIAADTDRQLRGATAPCVVFDVPLLVESGRWRQRVDRVLVIDCPAEVQVDRVMRRAGWSRDAVLRVIGAQAPRALRRAAADAVIDNGTQPIAALAAAIDVLWAHWMPDAQAG